MPYEAEEPNPHHIGGEAGIKDPTWSTEIDHHNNDSDDDDDDRRTERGGRQEEDEYALLHSTETDDGRHPGRPLSWGEDRAGYGSGRSRPGVSSYGGYDDANNSNALSPGGYEEYRREANQSTVSSAYSQSQGGGYASHGGQGYSFSGGDR